MFFHRDIGFSQGFTVELFSKNIPALQRATKKKRRRKTRRRRNKK